MSLYIGIEVQISDFLVMDPNSAVFCKKDHQRAVADHAFCPKCGNVFDISLTLMLLIYLPKILDCNGDTYYDQIINNNILPRLLAELILDSQDYSL